MKIVTITPVKSGGKRHPEGTALDLGKDDADALIAGGAALTPADYAALPKPEAAEGAAAAAKATKAKR